MSCIPTTNERCPDRHGQRKSRDVRRSVSGASDRSRAQARPCKGRPFAGVRAWPGRTATMSESVACGYRQRRGGCPGGADEGRMKDFRQIFEHAPAPFTVLDRQFRYVTANRAYLQTTASRMEELEGRCLFDVFPDEPGDPNRAGALMLRASLERVLATGRADTLALIPYKVTQHTAQGVVLQDRYWSATHTPLFDEQGEVGWILQYTEDVTELHRLRRTPPAGESGDEGPSSSLERLQAGIFHRAQRLQQENFVLERERQHLRQLFEQAPGFVCILRGPDLIFEIANAAYRGMVGRQNLIGLPMAQALPEVVEQGFIGLLERVLATAEAYVGREERVLLQRDGVPTEFFLDFIYQPIHEPDGHVSGIFVLGHDVTARVRAHEDLQKHREHLEELVQTRTADLAQAEAALYQAQKMEAVGRLTGGVAHDFNNLLQVIGGNLQLLQAGLGDDDARAGKRVGNALVAVERGAKLAAQLLAFARRQPLQPQVLDAARLMNGLADMLRRVIGEAIALETSAVGNLWSICADPAQMENALLNLAINARDAMAGEGRLVLKAHNITVGGGAAGMDVPEPGDYVLLSVSDTGGGMSGEVCRQAFEPFFTTKPEGLGSGLGLSMVYGFVKQSGGHVSIDSAVGIGTTVNIYLPRVDGVAVDEPVTASLPAVGGSETILVVEDDVQVRATVVEMLTHLGYAVRKASSGQEALAELQADPGVDLLFTDVVMPGPLKSTLLARQAREIAPGIGILFTSGYPRDAIVHDGRLDAGVSLLSKPYTRDALARAIRKLLLQRDALDV
ncbi:PAS domain-containing sensor histidine kinase [Frateuria sp. STR12]|uniref:PAS domain-containing sensor histidine kinase n=1 Tax=Frateuria hangzhouensis TaxID=2995589 RepID=UPI002260F234|nr:PAS domain-containing sensor histidine kinase [Frateuria sp. STR12]MCX7515154.1 PAS domain-containing protein [Frateuria sp. STR12]